MYSVYWIHLPEHTDMFTQGYIGVSGNTTARFYVHENCSENRHLSHAFSKYGDRIIKSIILVGSEDYCYEIEEKIRPVSSIGWNIAQGGGRPPSWKGIEKTPDHCANISKAKTGKKRLDTPWNKGLKLGPQSEETKAKRSKALKGRTYEDLYGDKADEMRAKRTGRPKNGSKI